MDATPPTDQVRQPPMRGRYFVRHKGFNALFRTLDFVLGLLARPRGRSAEPVAIERILLCNGAHLGDVVLSTAVLPVLKAAFPQARIGMLVGTWAASIVREHPLVDRVHTVDHWLMNRGAATRWQKLRTYWRSRGQALREIREQRYDVAIDLYFYFPNSILLLRQAGIPRRIGYTSAGFGPLLTERLDLHGLSDRSMVDYHLDLVRRIPGAATVDAALAQPSVARRRVDVAALAGDGPYVVVHMGSGSPLKDWPVASWHRLVHELAAAGHRLVFTGSGARERAQAAAIASELPGATDLSDRLKWAEFVEVVAGADLLAGVDSVAGHVAAAVGTPVVIAGHGMNNLVLWRPVGRHVAVLRHPTPCAPCYRKSGCAGMTCLRELAPAVVADCVTELLACAAAEAA